MDNTNNIANQFAEKQAIIPQDGSAEQQTNAHKPEVAQVQVSEQHKQEKSSKPESTLQAPQTANEETAATKPVESNKQPSLCSPTQPENSRGLESLLKTINQGIKARQFQGNLPLNIKVGSSVVFQAVSGKKPTTNKITPEQITLLQKALSDPESVQGAVRISVGNETVFHVKDGELKVDKLGFAQGQSQTQESSKRVKKEAPAQTQQTQPQSQSNQTQSTPSQATQTITTSVETEIASLRLLVSQQQQQLNQMNQKLDRLMSSPPVVVIVGSDQLKNWFGNLHSKIQKAGQQAVAHASNQLEQNKTTLRSKVQQLWSGVKETVTDKIHAASNVVQTKAGEIALGAMSAVTTNLASALGEKLPDGSFVIENRNLNQRLEVNGNSVALKQRPQQDALELWNNYSQGISSDRPVLRTLAVAQNALRDGMTKAGVEDLLKADPQFQKLQQEQGSNQAENYVKQMTRSAVRREQPTQEKPQQLSRAQTQNQGKNGS